MALANSGIVIRALPKTSYDFSGLKANVGLTFPIVQKVCITPFTEATWMIRVHSGTINANPGTIVTFTTVIEGYDFGDPGVIFSQNGNTLSVNSTNALPFYQVLAAQTTAGRLLRLDINPVQGNVAAAALNFTLSVDIALKGGDGSYAIAPNEFRGYRIL